MNMTALDKTHTTAYKGLAILLVVICHTMGKFGHGLTLFTPCGGIGVAIFLLLSGYGLNESWSNSRGTSSVGWWRKRFIAVWIPYIFVQLIAYWPFHDFKLIPFFLDLSLVKPLYNNGWYLQYLFLWYVLFFLIRKTKVFQRDQLICLSVYMFLCIFCFIVLREIKAEQSFSFFLGIVLSEGKGRNLDKKLFNLRYGLLFLFWGLMCLAFKQLPFVRSAPQFIMNLVQLGIKLPIGFGLMILCFMIIERKKQICTVLGFVGVCSYEMYLIHGYVLAVVPSKVVGVISFVFITIFLSVAYWQIMKRLRPLWFKVFGLVQEQSAQ